MYKYNNCAWFLIILYIISYPLVKLYFISNFAYYTVFLTLFLKFILSLNMTLWHMRKDSVSDEN